jgi:hypothetical protein
MLHTNRSGSWSQEAGQHAQCGCFAGTIGTQKAEYFAFLNAEGYLIHGTEIFIVFGQMLDLDHNTPLITDRLNILFDIFWKRSKMVLLL